MKKGKNKKRPLGIPVMYDRAMQTLYSAKEGAIEQNEKLKQIVNPFIVEEEGKFRILTGIYTEQDYDGIVKK